MIILNIFLDVGLLLSIIGIYDPMSKVLRDISNEVLLRITRDEIREVFKTYDPFASLEDVDLERCISYYSRTRDLVKGKFLPTYIVKEDQKNILWGVH